MSKLSTHDVALYKLQDINASKQLVDHALTLEMLYYYTA